MPEVIINGPAGRIEGKYHQNPNPKAPVALVLHPHPLHGGTMNNKITYSLYKNFVNNGFSVLRINFRGVGKSQGKFDGGNGELLDVTAVMNWLHDQNMESSDFWIAGFSFGSWIALQLLMRRPEIENYILVGPPVGKYDFNFVVPCNSNALVVQGDEDEISKEADTASLVEKLNAMKDDAEIAYKIIHGGDHFFKSKMEEFEAIIDNYVKGRLIAETGKVRKVKRDRRRRRKKKNVIEKKPERNQFPVKPLSFFEN